MTNESEIRRRAGLPPKIDAPLIVTEVSEVPMSDLSKPHVPTRGDIAKISEEVLPSIERDWGKVVDPRLRAVLQHHMTAVMLEVSKEVLGQKKMALHQLLNDIDNQRMT